MKLEFERKLKGKTRNPRLLPILAYLKYWFLPSYRLRSGVGRDDFYLLEDYLIKRTDPDKDTVRLMNYRRVDWVINRLRMIERDEVANVGILEVKKRLMVRLKIGKLYLLL